MKNLINVTSKLIISSLKCSKIKATMNCIVFILSLGTGVEAFADSVQTQDTFIDSANAADFFYNITYKT